MAKRNEAGDLTHEIPDNPVPEFVPEFFWRAMCASDMTVFVGMAMIVYEQGTGGPIKKVAGTIITPAPDQEAILPGMLWVMPAVNARGEHLQDEESVSLLQIPHSRIIEIGSTVPNENDDDIAGELVDQP